MKAIVTLTILSVFLMMTPDMANAGDRDRHDRQYGKDRDYSISQHEQGRDKDGRHDRYWEKQQRHKKHNKYWKKHRSNRQVVYRTVSRRAVYKPFMSQIVYRDPVVYYPVSYLTVGVPNLNLRVSW